MPNQRRYPPLGPLLDAFRNTKRHDRQPSQRIAAIRAARGSWLNGHVLDSAASDELTDWVTGFYRAVVPFAWHEAAVVRGLGLLRHGLTHLIRGQEPLAVRYGRCVNPDGPYFVTGLGMSFWSAAVKALDPDHLPDLTPAVCRGLVRLGLFRPTTAAPDELFSLATQTYTRVMSDASDLTATDLDAFFTAAAGMIGRELGPVDSELPAQIDLPNLLRTIRGRSPVRRRAAEFGDGIVRARRKVEADLIDSCQADLPDVLREFGYSPPRQKIDERVIRDVVSLSDTIREPTDLIPLLVPDAGGVWLLSVLLHLRSPNRFPVWTESAEQAAGRLDDSYHRLLPPATRYSLLCELVSELRRRYRVHPGEVGPLLAVVAEGPGDPQMPTDGRFAGFCTDTFRFLNDLAGNNETGWMAARRERYRFAVREPIVEFCSALAARYVRPVLYGEYGWDLETEPRPGRALTSICKNDFGRGGPYQPVLWVTFYRRAVGRKQDDVQLFFRLDPTGVSFGFHLGPKARDASRRFRKAVQEHGELLFAAVRVSGAVEHCRFGADPFEVRKLRSPADLRAWAAGKELFASVVLPSDAALLRSDDLVGEVLILFDRLVPLLAAAVDDDPRPILAARAGTPDGKPAFDREAFRSATFLGDLWLTRTLDLLRLKKQLVLQGVPGTGKTHVARCLARLLTGDRSENIRFVQFHPGYSYEEFVEGIRPQAVEMDGRTHVSYPVEPGLLATFADRAARHPSESHVLVIDEVNRGNLPRVFGELLFLLEYREQEVMLPYSKKPFRVPVNLYLIATMNPTDRSAVGLDQATRRRFSFVDMAPDPAVLARWFEAHPPADPDPTLAPRLVRWFEDLNRRVARDLGPDRQVGHSFFMLPDLTADQLRAVWEHHIRPALAEFFTSGIPRVYDIERLLSKSSADRTPVEGRRR